MAPADLPDLVERLRRHRVVGIVRHSDAGVAESIARAMLDAGLEAVEVTWTVPGAPALIRRLVADYPDRFLGAGTVVHPEQVDAVVEAGAQYVITPALRPAVLAAAAAHAIPVLPGLMTPTELYLALDLGVRAVKVFPAGTLGPGHLRALREVAPEVAYVPTGGVAPGNVGEWLAAGATAVAVAGAFSAAWRESGAAGVAVTARTLLAEAGADPAT